ncbi:hypothetical protein [Pseudoduganella violacea]|uniref:Cell division septal protein FtsQ n=1 Tax=Pseudoduganella violacea TaxID=1715466 RepID=A0A7W5FXD7_9BURK|nr:hypothetical protein [Pseudoduganella violacea]MBB3122153.1 cell division septal protein FtsQ [Pseudoduganella violacea]
MNVFYRELLLLGIVFFGVLIFIWCFIAADLPDDFIAKVKASANQEEEDCDGSLRDHR